jgi:hypothetical protein
MHYGAPAAPVQLKTCLDRLRDKLAKAIAAARALADALADVAESPDNAPCHLKGNVLKAIFV